MKTRLKFSWLTALIGIVIIKAVLSLAVNPGSFLVSYSGISYLLLLLLATGFSIRNGIQNILGSRAFWAFLGTAYGIWAMHQFVQVYYELGQHVSVPDHSIADTLLFLHVVPLMAAVAILPNWHVSNRKAYRVLLDSLLLVFFWTFVYGYSVFPYQYLYATTSYAVRFDIIYFLENLSLVVGAAIFTLRMEGPWRRVYLHLVGASALYIVSSTYANLAIDSRGYVNGKLYGLGLTASVCWSIWIPLQARRGAAPEIVADRSDRRYNSLSSAWAMAAVVIISFPAVWELLRRNENTGLPTLRMVVAFAALVCLASAAYIREYLERRELASRMDEALSAMSRKLVESQEQECSRIGRELHDDINQRLAMLSLELQRLPETPSEIQIRIEELRNELRQISDDVQALSHDLHSSKMEYLGVVRGMKSWCKEFSERRNFEIDFQSDVSSPISRELGLGLFRVLQEALQNVVKHSGARRVEVHLLETSGEIHLVISDSGRGFDVAAALQGNGLGLTSMRERVRLMSGTIKIDSKPMGGTRVQVCATLPSEREAQLAG